jgi:hypothetical protein
MAEERRGRLAAHEHLKTGGFGDFDCKRVIHISRERLGSGGIVGIINYNPSERYSEFCYRANNFKDCINYSNSIYLPEEDLLFLNGDEIETRQGHLIGLCLEKGQHPKFGRDVGDSIKEIRSLGGLTVVDHPFHMSGLGDYLRENPEIYRELDFYEVHNGEASLWIPGKGRANKKAFLEFQRALVYNPSLAMLIAGDGHSTRELGLSWIELPFLNLSENSDVDGDKIKDSLKKGLLKTTLRGFGDFDCNPGTSHLGALEHIAKHLSVKITRKIGIRLGKN